MEENSVWEPVKLLTVERIYGHKCHFLFCDYNRIVIPIRPSDSGHRLRPARARLDVNQPCDKREQESERVADDVMRMLDPRLKTAQT